MIINKNKKSMIKIPRVFFWEFYSCGKLTCTKTFCFMISTKECICNTQFYGLVTPTVHSSALSLKNPKLREQLFSGKKSSPTHESPFNFKNWSGKSDEFEKLVGEKWRIFQKWLNFSPTKLFPDIFFPNKVSIFVASGEKRTVPLSPEPIHRKSTKVFIPLKHLQFKVISYIKCKKTPDKSLQVFTIATMKISLFNIYKICKKIDLKPNILCSLNRWYYRWKWNASLLA